MSSPCSKGPAAEFFEALYGAESEGHLVIWVKGGRTVSFPAGEWAEAGRFIEKWTKTHDVYFGVGLQGEPPTGTSRGKADGVLCIPGLWVDIDIRGPGHMETALPASVEEALRVVQEFPLPPSLLVHSGGGLHAYWLFHKPWVFHAPEEREQAKLLSKEFQAKLRIQAEANGWKLDSTHDLARVLRPAGSVNRKRPENLVAVKVLELHEDRRYSTDEVRRAVGEGAPTPATCLAPRYLELLHEFPELGNFRFPPSLTGAGRVQDSPPPPLDPIVEGCSWLRHCRDDAATLPEPEWYAMLSVVARCSDGEKACHAWSAPHHGYSYPETEKKRRHALEGPGPVTCERVAAEFGRAIACRGCVYHGKVKSPIVLGYERSRSVERVAAAKSVVDGLGAKVREDAGAVFAPEVVGALAVLQREAPEEWARAKKELKGKVPLRDLQTKMREANIRVAAEGDVVQTTLVGPLLPGAPVPEGSVVPESWAVSLGGVLRIRWTDVGAQMQTVANSPIVIAARTKDLHTGQESLHLAFWRDNRWASVVAERAAVMDARKLVALAGQGFPVTSKNAGDLTAYLEAYESANLHLLPVASVSGAMGWQGAKGTKGFLWGRHFLPPDGTAARHADLEEQDPGEWGQDHVYFRGTGGGEEQLAASMHAAGTFEAWRAGVAAVAHHKRALLALYGSLAAPLLDVLGAPNFILDWYGATSSGKTTALRIAASCWGNPATSVSDSYLRSWDATRVSIEHAAIALNSLPLILDDTKRAKKPALVAQTIYDYANGQGRGRGAKAGGTRRVEAWRGVLLSSGEAPATSFTEDGGTRARTLEIYGSPFDEKTEATAQEVLGLREVLEGNYGHAGARLVAYLQKHRAQWDEWAQLFRETRSLYAKRAGDNAVAGRLGESLAALEVTAMLAHKALELPWKYEDQVSSLWDTLAPEAEEADRAQRALSVAYDWATANQTSFWGRHRTDAIRDVIVPHSGLAGRWDAGDGWTWIGFYPDRLAQLLKQHGLELEAVERIWHDRGWMETDQDGKRRTKKVRLNGSPVRLLAVKRDAIDTLLGGRDSQECKESASEDDDDGDQHLF